MDFSVVQGSSHAFVIPVIVLIATLLMVWHLRNENTTPQRIIWMQMSIGLIGLVGAKVFSLYVRGWEMYSPFLVELQVGWRYPGAILALLIFVPLIRKWILPKVGTLRYLDAMVLIVGVGLGLWRISCYLNGCCVGAVCDANYCVSYPQGSIVFNQQLGEGLISNSAVQSLPVFPLQFLFMAATFLVVGFLFWFNRFKQYDGQLILLYAFLHEGLKAWLEFLRSPYLSELQIASAVVSVVALLALIVVHLFYVKKQSG